MVVVVVLVLLMEPRCRTGLLWRVVLVGLRRRTGLTVIGTSLELSVVMVAAVVAGRRVRLWTRGGRVRVTPVRPALVTPTGRRPRFMPLVATSSSEVGVVAGCEFEAS